MEFDFPSEEIGCSGRVVEDEKGLKTYYPLAVTGRGEAEIDLQKLDSDFPKGFRPLARRCPS